MKNTAFIAIALLFGAVANAQTGTPAQTQPVRDTIQKSVADTSSTTTLIDTSVGKAYVAHPERLQGLTTETLTPAHIFPALGTYKGTGTSTADVTVTLDETNKGIVWVDGLPQGKFKALMKKAPSTYKIPAQKSETGKAVAEGTLYVNPDTNEITILLGRPFDDANPSSFLTISSKKKNIWQYTGVKTDAGAAVVTPASSQQ
jgi:hypothetical protein